MSRIYADEPLQESIGTPAEREAKLNRRIAELQAMKTTYENGEKLHSAYYNRAITAEAQLDAVRKVSENGNLSWQDKHIAIWKIVHPTALNGKKEPNNG